MSNCRSVSDEWADKVLHCPKRVSIQPFVRFCKWCDAFNWKIISIEKLMPTKRMKRNRIDSKHLMAVTTFHFSYGDHTFTHLMKNSDKLKFWPRKVEWRRNRKEFRGFRQSMEEEFEWRWNFCSFLVHGNRSWHSLWLIFQFDGTQTLEKDFQSFLSHFDFPLNCFYFLSCFSVDWIKWILIFFLLCFSSQLYKQKQFFFVNLRSRNFISVLDLELGSLSLTTPVFSWRCFSFLRHSFFFHFFGCEVSVSAQRFSGFDKL
jgi:hypothetical protein